jgi:putative hemolysin
MPVGLLKNFSPFRFFQERKLLSFQAKASVYQSSENFILKTVETPAELRQVLELRHEIFYKELLNKETASQLDVDEMDFLCDHLLILDRESGRALGTYRLISSRFSPRFYSSGEFAIDGILQLPGHKLELGRACIHQEYRNGAIINLLWKGIAEYVRKTETKYLFGCASVQTTDPRMASQLYAYLQGKGLATGEYNVGPTEKYRSPLPVAAAAVAAEEMGRNLPPLIQSYVLAGAKFYGEPALDRDFQCYDFFMMLKIEEMSRLFRRRYRLDD